MKIINRYSVKLDKYYLIYNDHNPYIALVSGHTLNLTGYTEIYAICNIKIYNGIGMEHITDRRLSLTYGDEIYELTDSEVLDHVLMEMF